MRLLPLVLLLAAAPAAAQSPAATDTAALPAWVVPVLRLVSETHAEPTTGIVLSRDGLVLVPDTFSAFGDEVVVLDGGTDIVRHGRPARRHSAYPELGLEVLEIPGLARAGAPLAAAPLAVGDTVRLRAFPPAEQIAEGAPPVEQAADVVRIGADGTRGIVLTAPLPNVTGPLLDACGNLAGFSLADGVQTMAPAAGTQYRWLAALRQVLDALQLPATGVPCRRIAAEEALPVAPPAAEPPGEEPTAATADRPAPEAESAAGDLDPSAEPDTAPEPSPDIGIELESLPPLEDDSAAPEAGLEAPGHEPSSARSWWWLLGGLLLLAGGLAVHRLRKGKVAGEATGDAESPDEVGDSGHREEEAANTARPPPDASSPDSRLVLRGQYADGRPLEVDARVNAGGINLEIGRGSVELALDSAAVSRRHARLNGTADALTIADLGSSNGTSIDGVPCLEGEIMYLEPGCTVVLGDARFTVSVEPERTSE